MVIYYEVLLKNLRNKAKKGLASKKELRQIDLLHMWDLNSLTTTNINNK